MSAIAGTIGAHPQVCPEKGMAERQTERGHRRSDRAATATRSLRIRPRMSAIHKGTVQATHSAADGSGVDGGGRRHAPEVRQPRDHGHAEVKRPFADELARRSVA